MSNRKNRRQALQQTQDGEMLMDSSTHVAYFPSTSLAITTNARTAAATGPTTPRRDDQGEDGILGNVVASWGPNNNLPQQIIKDIEANPELAQILYSKANAVISGGLVYGHRQVVDGVIRLVPVIDPEVEQWLANTNVAKYLREASKEFYSLWHGFTEFLMNPAKDYISAIACHETSYCRFGVQDQNGRIPWTYICANWETVSNVTDASVWKRPLLDPYFGVLDQIRYGGATRYIYPTAGTASGRTYYQPAPWHSLRTSGWLALANAIPKFKKALMANQFTIKYHVQIPDWWWKQKYPNWDKEPKKQPGWIEAELLAFNKKMAGEANAGNSILTMLKTDANGKAYEGWKIDAIDDKLQDGKYIEDSQEASSHIFFAVGMDPTLIGAAPGKGLGAGSGSDKRIAYNIQQLNSKPEADILLEPLQVAFNFNGFGTKNSPTGLPYTIWFSSYYLQTLDQGTTKQKEKQNQDQPTE